MNLTNYKIGDEHKILELFELTFGRKMSLNYWNWRFKNNPTGIIAIKLIWDQDILVGHYAVSPLKMVINGQTKLTALSMTTMTHPEYAGKGIFTKLASSLDEVLHTDYNINAVWGFPNNNSHYMYVNKLGWTDLSVVHSLHLNANRFKESNNVSVDRFYEFTNIHVDKLEKLSSNSKVKVQKDLNYLQWRYVENPVADYLKFNVKTPNEDGFIIIKKFKSTTEIGSIELNIMELGIEDASLVSEILFKIKEYLNEEVILNANIWISLWDKRHSLLEKAGFAPFGKQTFLGIKCFEDSPEILDFRNWHYSYGDSDVY